MSQHKIVQNSASSGIRFGSWAEAFDSLDTGVSIISPSPHKLDYVNRAYREITGIPDSINSGASADDLYLYLAQRGDFGEGDPAELAFQKMTALTNQSWTDGIQNMANGKTIKIRRTYSADGFIITSITDVTEVKRSESLASTVLDSTDQGIVIVDAQDNIETVNHAYREMFDFHDNVLDSPCTFQNLMLIAWKSEMFAGDFYGKLVSTLSVEEFKHRAVEFTALSLKKPVTIEISSGRYLRFVSRLLEDQRRLYTFTDISDGVEREKKLKQAQRLAESADRSKSEFLANMSHEIRTPMNGVMGMAELLSNTELNAKQKSFTDIILSSSAALLTIINDILDFSKIEAGRLELYSNAFNLRDAVQDVAALIGANIAKKELELIVRIQPDLPEVVLGDVGRFRQILTNIVGNAEKFTQSGHILINVSGETIEEKVVLECSVQDTGIGIPEDQISGIFEKFSQVDSSSTRQHEGTGLGLAIASRLVGLMGGKIGCRSQTDQGSTFWFTTDFQIGIDHSCDKVPHCSIEGMRLLAIDDNPINRAILLEQFSNWKLLSDAASNGEVGLQMMRQAAQDGRAYDAIVLDCQMPGMCGTEVAQAIRNDPQLRNTPIIMLTSFDQSEKTEKRSGLNLDAKLTKPVRASQLLQSIETAIQNRQHQQAPLPLWLQATAEIEMKPDLTPSRNVDILIVDCEPANQLLFSQIFSHLGISSKAIDSSADALTIILDTSPEVVLLDISNPDGSGQKLCEAIRGAGEGIDGSGLPMPKIVGITNPAQDIISLAELEFGLDTYISKPVSPNNLIRKINKIAPDFFKEKESNSCDGQG